MNYIPDSTLSIFHKRLAEALPDVSGLQTIVEPRLVDKTLRTLLKEPLVFDDEITPRDTLWWFRGGSSLPIERFEVLGGSQYLVGDEELRVTELTAYVDHEEPDLSFVYLGCDPLPPILDEQIDVKSQLEWCQYANEEVGYSPTLDKYFSASDFYEGTMYWGDERITDAELRTRYLSRYNVFIAPKESRLNNTGGTPGLLLEKACNDMLLGNLGLAQYIELLRKIPTARFRARLLGLE